MTDGNVREGEDDSPTFTKADSPTKAIITKTSSTWYKNTSFKSSVDLFQAQVQNRLPHKLHAQLS